MRNFKTLLKMNGIEYKKCVRVSKLDPDLIKKIYPPSSEIEEKTVDDWEHNISYKSGDFFIQCFIDMGVAKCTAYEPEDVGIISFGGAGRRGRGKILTEDRASFFTIGGDVWYKFSDSQYLVSKNPLTVELIKSLRETKIQELSLAKEIRRSRIRSPLDAIRIGLETKYEVQSIPGAIRIRCGLFYIDIWISKGEAIANLCWISYKGSPTKEKIASFNIADPSFDPSTAFDRIILNTRNIINLLNK